MLIPNFYPESPDEYHQSMDPLRRDWRVYVNQAGIKEDVEWHVRKIRELFPLTPLDLLLKIINKRAEVSKNVLRVLGPYVQVQMWDYFTSHNVPTNLIPDVPDESRLAFYLLWCGDTPTSFHSMNASLVTQSVSRILGVKEEPTFLAQAGLLHDIGKGDIPRFVLENPTSRELMGPLYRTYLEDERRPMGVPIVSPVELTSDEKVTYEPLLSGRSKDPQLIVQFGDLCASKPKADYRKGIPLEAFLDLARYITTNKCLPPKLQQYVEQYLPNSGVEEIDHMASVFSTYSAELINPEMILARYGIARTASMMTAFQKHEASSFKYVPSALGCVVARHHNYSLTRDSLIARAGYLPPPSQLVCVALTLSDIIVALAEKRRYFRNGKPKPISVIAKNLAAEAAAYGIPSDQVRSIIEALLQGEETENPLEVIFERSLRVLESADQYS